MESEFLECLELVADVEFGEMDEIEGFPVPFVMDDFIGHLDAEVGGDGVVDEAGFTSGREMEFLQTFSEIYF